MSNEPRHNTDEVPDHVKMTIDALQSQPFPYVLVIGNGVKDSTPVSDIYFSVQPRYAANIANCLESMAHEIRNKFNLKDK